MARVIIPDRTSVNLTTEEKKFLQIHDEIQDKITWFNNQLKSNNQRRAVDILLARRFGSTPLPDKFPWVYRYLIGDDTDRHIISKNPFLTNQQWLCNCHNQSCIYFIRMESALKSAFD